MCQSIGKLVCHQSKKSYVNLTPANLCKKLTIDTWMPCFATTSSWLSWRAMLSCRDNWLGNKSTITTKIWQKQDNIARTRLVWQASTGSQSHAGCWQYKVYSSLLFRGQLIRIPIKAIKLKHWTKTIELTLSWDVGRWPGDNFKVLENHN